jgi:hypothetical protein
LGDVFEILTATEGLGGSDFDTADLPALAAGLQWSLTYGLDAVSLAVALAGDYNHNGTVEAGDYTVWRNTLGQSGTGLAADGNGDQMITGLDYDVWKSNFGNTLPGGGSTAEIGAVPEPLPLVLLAIGSLLSLGITGRRRRTALTSRRGMR